MCPSSDIKYVMISEFSKKLSCKITPDFKHLHLTPQPIRGNHMLTSQRWEGKHVTSKGHVIIKPVNSIHTWGVLRADAPAWRWVLRESAGTGPLLRQTNLRGVGRWGRSWDWACLCRRSTFTRQGLIMPGSINPWQVFGVIQPVALAKDDKGHCFTVLLLCYYNKQTPGN